MMVLIKEWPNKTATILTENGQVVWTFSNVAAACTACREWQGINTDENVQVVVDKAENSEPVPQVA